MAKERSSALPANSSMVPCGTCPKPESLARLLDDPHIRSALLFVPGQEDKAAWPTHLARALLRASRWIFLLGLLGLIAALWPSRASNRGASSRIGDQTGPV